MTEKDFLEPAPPDKSGICKDCEYKSDCSQVFDFCPFDGKKAAEKYDRHKKCKHTKFLRACAQCHMIMEDNNLSSKEQIIASLGDLFSEFEEEDIDQMATYHAFLLKRVNNKLFLEKICEVLWDYSVKMEHMETIMREEESK